MNEMDLDQLIESAAVEASIEEGVSTNTLISIGTDPKLLAVTGSLNTGKVMRNPKWTPEEDAFVKDNLGVLSLADIGNKIGRSKVAVKIRFTRLGFRPPEKHPDYFTMNQLSIALGVDVHAVMRWEKLGFLEFEPLPGTVVRRISKKKVYQWCVNPKNWIYFLSTLSGRTPQIHDPKLARLIELRKKRWGDEWWSIGQVAKYHDVDYRVVNKKIHDGKIPGVQWGNWHILKSHATNPKLLFKKGKGNRDMLKWTDAGQAFILLASAAGVREFITNKLMGYKVAKSDSLGYRKATIIKRGMAERLINNHFPEIQYREIDGAFFVDWRKCGTIFPFLERAAAKYNSDQVLTGQDILDLRRILYVWATWYAKTHEQKKFARSFRSGGRLMSIETLRRKHAQLIDWCPDPLL